MREIYDEMRARNFKNAKDNGLVFDEKIALNKIDNRKGIGIFGMGEFHLNSNFEAMYFEASEQFHGQTLYNTSSSLGVLHFTFMQFRKVENQDSDVNALSNLADTYAEKIAPILYEMGEIQIDYEGLIAIPSGLLMYGYPNKDVNAFRNKIRSLGLDIQEPYKTDITHSTFIRLCDSNCNPETLLNFADKYSKVNLGFIKVNELFLGLGSWRMQSQEIIMRYKFDLIKKTNAQLSNLPI